MKFRASHILVAHEYEALDIIRLLQAGKSFEALAEKYSRCPSSKVGGDLGYFKPGKMDEDFEEAVLGLKVGEVSTRPVRTKFGYHLIKRFE